jgi:hypothetical protein
MFVVHLPTLNGANLAFCRFEIPPLDASRQRARIIMWPDLSSKSMVPSLENQRILKNA